LRSFRHSYRMPPVVPLDQERGGRRGEEKRRGKGYRTSSPAVMTSVMKSMVPFRRKTPPPVTGEELAEQANANTNTKKKERKNMKSKDKGKEKGRTSMTTTKRIPTKSVRFHHADLLFCISISISICFHIRPFEPPSFHFFLRPSPSRRCQGCIFPQHPSPFSTSPSNYCEHSLRFSLRDIGPSCWRGIGVPSKSSQQWTMLD
jgi:hypothetical protein